MGGLTWWCWHRRHKTSMVKLGIKKHRFETWRDSLARKKTCRNETIFIVIFMVILFVLVCLGTRFFVTDTHTSFTSLYRYNVYIYNIYIDTISICIQYLYVYIIHIYIIHIYVVLCVHLHTQMLWIPWTPGVFFEKRWPRWVSSEVSDGKSQTNSWMNF